MIILHINAVYKYSSTGRNVYELHHELLHRGHESFVAYATINASDEHERLYRIGNTIDHKIHALLARLYGKQGYFSCGETSKLLRYIDYVNPDVVHLGNLHSNFINLPMLLKYLAEKDIATVITLHDCWFFTGKCYHYINIKCDKWKVECCQCPALKQHCPSLFFDYSKEMYYDKKNLFGKIRRLGIVGVSDWITGEVKQSILNRAIILRRIYNWIDLSIFYPHNTFELRNRLRLDGKFVILGVAQGWSDKKGINEFIAIANKLQDDIRIVLIGNLNINKYNIPDNVISVNYTESIKELAEYYSMADIFLNLSATETFGKVTAEALACGTPAIVYNNTACPELIGPGCGYVIEEKNIKEIISKINLIKLEGKKRYSEACRKFAYNNFNSKDQINKYIILYSELIKMK